MCIIIAPESPKIQRHCVPTVAIHDYTIIIVRIRITRAVVLTHLSMHLAGDLFRIIIQIIITINMRRTKVVVQNQSVPSDKNLGYILDRRGNKA